MGKIIQYTLEEITDAIQNFDTKKLEKIVSSVAYSFWFRIEKYIPSEVYYNDNFLQMFVRITGIPQIAPIGSTTTVKCINKNDNYFSCEFCQIKKYKFDVICNKGWKVEDFVNEQKWIDNINDAINQIKRDLHYQINKNNEILSHLPQTELTFEDFNN